MAVANPPVSRSSPAMKSTANGSCVVARTSWRMASRSILRRHSLLHPFAQRLEEVGLLDVFFAVQRHEIPIP